MSEIDFFEVMNGGSLKDYAFATLGEDTPEGSGTAAIGRQLEPRRS